MLKILQILHLSFIFLIIVLFTVFKMVSEPHDYWGSFLDTIFYLSSGIWFAFVIIQTIKTGVKEKIVPSLLKLYRENLSNYYFVVVSDILLIIVVCTFTYNLATYRQVEINSNTTFELILNDKPGKLVRMGRVAADEPTKFRLHIGKRMLTFYEPNAERILGSKILIVPPIWKSTEDIIVPINLNTGEYYETDN